MHRNRGRFGAPLPLLWWLGATIIDVFILAGVVACGLSVFS